MSGFKNKARAIRRLRAMPPAVRKAVRAQLAKNAEELVQTVKAFAPVDEGDLQASVEQRDTSDASRISREVRVEARDERGRPYPRWVEFGTSDSQPRPFFWPAYRLKRRRFKSRLTRVARKAIEEAIKR